jgi:hypothetical protein
MRLTFSGWRLRSKPEVLILHRFFWKKTWLNQLDQHPAAKPVLSRIGRTHLVIESNPPTRKVSIKIVSGAALLILISMSLFVIAQNSLIRKPSATAFTPQPVSSAVSNSESSCPKNTNSYSEKLADWYSGGDVYPLNIQKDAQHELGGVRSTNLLLTCQGSQRKFRITEVIQSGVWKIKETAQLDD